MNRMCRLPWMKRAAIAALFVGAGLGPTAGYSASPGSGKWIQRQPKGAIVLPPHLINVQCPSVDTCYALGSPLPPSTDKPILEKTTDAGATWTSQQMTMSPYDVSVGTLRPLACPDTTTCYVLQGTLGTDATKATPGVLVTRDGGTSWTHLQLPGAGTAALISCPTSVACYVAVSTPDSAGGSPTEVLFVTKDGGATWSRRALTGNASQGPPDMLACPDPSTCYIGATLATPGGGPTGAQALAATHDGGTTWTSWQIGVQSGFSSLACASPDTCYASGNATLAVTQDGGTSWSVRAAPWPYPYQSSMACPGLTTCDVLVSGAGIWETTDAGATWRQARMNEEVTLYDLACPAVTSCLAVGEAGLIMKSADSLSWSQASASVDGALTAVSCPADEACFAAGSDGAVMATTDGGKTWSRHPASTPLGLSALACPSTQVCTAVGWTGYGPSPRIRILRSTDGGATWKVEKTYRHAYPGPMACPSISECLITIDESEMTVADGMGSGGQVIVRTADGGLSWSAFPLPSDYSVQSISCPNTLTCVAAGGQEPCDDSLVPARGRPSNLRPKRTRRDAFFPCNVELGWLFATFDGGKQWQRVAFRPQALFAVSCPDPSYCYSTGDGIWAKSTDGGRHWRVTTRAQAAGPGTVTSLTCVDRSTCWGLAFTAQGTTVPMRTANAGQSWQTVTRGLPPTTSEFQGAVASIACRGASTCMAVGGGGLVLTYSP